MTKWLALMAILFTAACGSDSSPGAPNGDETPDEPLGGEPASGVRLALDSGTAVAKVIVRRGTVRQVTQCDEFDECWTVDQFVETFKYVTNVDPSRSPTINIPYGGDYVLEVIAGDGAGKVLGYYRSDYFDVPDTLTPAIPEQPAPAITFADIYVGLGAPYDRYTVEVGARGPFGGAWSLTCDGASPVVTTASAATFLSPTSAGTVDCIATFRLDASLLINGEPASAWEWVVPASHDPLPFGIVTVIP